MHIVSIEDKAFMDILFAAMEAFPSRFSGGWGQTAPLRKVKFMAYSLTCE